MNKIDMEEKTTADGSRES